MRTQRNIEQTMEYLQMAKLAAMQVGNCNDERFVVLCEDSQRAEIKDSTKQFVGRVAEAQPEVLLYLDKSTRPYSWLVRRLLGEMGLNYHPQTRYINIGTENSEDLKWLGKRKYNSSQWEVIDKLRQTYHDPAQPNMTVFAGKDVWVVDDFIVSGSSLRTAKHLVRAMSQRDGMEANVSTHYLSDTVSPWHATTGITGVEDSLLNPFLVSRGPQNLVRQLRTEMDYIAADVMADFCS